MKVDIQILRRCLLKLLDEIEQEHGPIVEVDKDLYWFIQKDGVYQPESAPSSLTIGSLEEDWKEVAAIGDGRKSPFYYGLVWASCLLRALGDKDR